MRKWGVRFFTVNKILFKHFVLLLLCVSVHNWSVSQWKQYELQIWSSWRNIIFLKVKSATQFDPWKWTCSQWVHSMLSSTYMTNQNITPVTDLHRGDMALYSAYKINYHYVLFLELEAPKCPSVERYVCWNVSWPASADNLVKNWLSLSSKLYSSHCGTSRHQAPMFYFTAKCLGSFKNIFCHSS